MADFTGLCVKVTLKQPPNGYVHGKVKHVLPGKTMTLQDAILPNGLRQAHSIIQSSAIADLQVVDGSTLAALLEASVPPHTLAHNNLQSRHHPVPISAPKPVQPAPPACPPPRVQSQRELPAFVDPAILSYDKSSTPSKHIIVPAASETPAMPIKPTPSMAVQVDSRRINGSSLVADAVNSHASHNRTAPLPPQASAQTHNSGLGIADGAQDPMHEHGSGDATSKKKLRGDQKQKQSAPSLIAGPVIDVAVSRNGNDMIGSVKRGRGWRQTALLQPSPQTTSPAVQTSDKQHKKRPDDSQKNGWATEDATDVQDLGDFDFEANHKLFDKKLVFDKLRQDDTTAEEDRLVSHNKLHPRPGTHGGKNLHATENVLSPQLRPTYESNDVDSTSDTGKVPDLASSATASGRSSSRHSSSRGGVLKKGPKRQNGTQTEVKPHPLSTSISPDWNMTRSVASPASRSGNPLLSASVSSPLPDRVRSPQSAVSSTKGRAATPLASTPGPAFCVEPSLSICSVLHFKALETLESVTVSKYGLTSDAISEAAARCIAETASSVLLEQGESRRGSRTNTLRGSMSASNTFSSASPPVVVILVGNHTVGARALAAARHLVSRNFQMIIAESLPASVEEQDTQLRTQVGILRRMTRAGAHIKRGPWRKATGYIKNLPAPPVIIIDALLAGSTYQSMPLPTDSSLLTVQAQQDTRQMIDWANRSRAPVLSVGCPSGVSSVDGGTTIVDGEPLAVRPEKVLALGMPMQGLLEAVKGGEKWDVSLADIGVNIALLSEEAVAFGGRWVVELRYVEGEAEEGAVEGLLA